MDLEPFHDEGKKAALFDNYLTLDDLQHSESNSMTSKHTSGDLWTYPDKVNACRPEKRAKADEVPELSPFFEFRLTIAAYRAFQWFWQDIESCQKHASFPSRRILSANLHASSCGPESSLG